MNARLRSAGRGPSAERKESFLCLPGTCPCSLCSRRAVPGYSQGVPLARDWSMVDLNWFLALRVLDCPFAIVLDKTSSPM